MTILHLIQKPQLRGAEIFASQLAKHTHLYGHKAVMVFLFPGNVQLPFDGKTISLDGTKSHRFWNITAWRKLAQIIREEKPDIIQANAGDTLKYAVFSKLLFRWKQPIVFRNASTISLYIKTWPAKVWNGFLFRQASRIISVSNVSAADFGTLYPRLKDRIAVVPIGIEEQSVKERPDAAEVQREDGPVLIHVGGFTYEKNHIRLISIFQRLLAIYPNACLRLVGDGPLRKDMEEIVQQKGLADHIVFCGAQKDVMSWLAEADVLLLPSIIEGLPGVILEAFYCRIPVVAYDVGGIKEILINDTTGHLVKKGDENAFVNAVVDVIRDNHDNERMITNARQLVIAGYLNRRITKRFIRVYESVIQHWNKNYHYRPLI